MFKYDVSQVVPSIEKVKLIKDAFKEEFELFIENFPFEEYNGYIRALERGATNDAQEDFIAFEQAFYNQTEAWRFIREIMELFNYLPEVSCEDCEVRSACFNIMTDERAEACSDADTIRDFKLGLILFIYRKYFFSEKMSLIYS